MDCVMFLGVGCWCSLCNCLVECWDGLVLDCGFCGGLFLGLDSGSVWGSKVWGGLFWGLVFWSVGIYLGYDLV